MWGDAIERAKRLRSRHIIRPSTFSGVGIVCAVDGVRIHPVKGGWRHDIGETSRVLAAAIRIAVPADLL